MVEFKSHEEFLSSAMEMLARRPDANVMIIVDSGKGLEVLQTNDSYTVAFGLLATAGKYLDERFRASMNAAANRKMEARIEADLSATIRTPSIKN